MPKTFISLRFSMVSGGEKECFKSTQSGLGPGPGPSPVSIPVRSQSGPVPVPTSVRFRILSQVHFGSRLRFWSRPSAGPIVVRSRSCPGPVPKPKLPEMPGRC